MDIIKVFKTVRDMPYRIPLALGERDVCCGGKHKILQDLLSKEGFEVRYRVCSFLWSSMDLPDKISNISHDDMCTHVWLEVNIDNEWVVVDATWDIGLKNIFHINEWDGKSNTKIAVRPLEIFSLQKSAEIMGSENDEYILNDLKTNGEFYKALNDWFAEQRISVSV